MADASGLLARFDWETATPGNKLMGFGTAPYIWSGYDENGGPVASADQWTFVDFGGSSGIVADRTNPTTVVPDRYHIVVLQSGFLRTDYNNKIVVDVEAAQAQAIAERRCHFDIYMRPSGVGHSAMHGFRYLWWRNRTTDFGGFDVIELLQHIGAYNPAVTGDHGNRRYFIPPTDTLRIRVEDDGTQLQLFVNHPQSGQWELTHHYTTSEYNDHPYSGMISAVNGDGGTNAEWDVYQIFGVTSGIFPASGYIGGYLDGGTQSTTALFHEKDAGILSWWYGNESSDTANLTDSGPYGNELSAQDTTKLDLLVPGVQNTNRSRDRARVCRNFSASDNARFGSNNNFGSQYCGDAIGDDFTIMAWVYPSGHHIGEDHKLVTVQQHDGTVDSTLRWMLQLTDGGSTAVDRIQFAHRFAAGGGNIDYLTTPATIRIPSGQFSFIGVTYNETGGEAIIYINDAAVTSGAVTGTISSGASDDIAVGGSPNVAVTDFLGAFNDIVFVSRAVSPEQMAYVGLFGIGAVPAVSGYVGGFVRSSQPLIFANDDEVIGYWKLEENSGTRYDNSGNSNDLDVITGAPGAIAGRIGNANRFLHWTEPYPQVARASSGLSSAFSITNEDWTMGCWIKPSGAAFEDYAQIMGKGGYDEYVLYLDSQLELWGQVRIEGVGYPVGGNASNPLTADTYQLIAWTVDRSNGVQSLYHVPVGLEPVVTLIASGTIPVFSDGIQSNSTLPFHIGSSPIHQEPVDADIDEAFFVTRVLSPNELGSIWHHGLPIISGIPNSGYVGGYVAAPPTASGTSGYIGAYYTATIANPSGYIGSFLSQLTVASGVSGYVGGFTDYSGVFQSGYIGGYTNAPLPPSGYIGAYLDTVGQSSGAFLSFFDFITPQSLDFDALVRVGAGNNIDFDATFGVRRTFTPPTVTCVLTGSGVNTFHEISVSGIITVGDISLPNGGINTINNAWAQFGDFSGVKLNLTGTDNAFSFNHVYTNSGVYILRIDAIDANGVHGSASHLVDLSVGLGSSDLVQVQLTTTSPTGAVPHTVPFVSTVSTIPVGLALLEQVIHFGDRTLTHVDDPTHLYHSPGNFIPIYTVKDGNNRFWNDSTDVGVNR